MIQLLHRTGNLRKVHLLGPLLITVQSVRSWYKKALLPTATVRSEHLQCSQMEKRTWWLVLYQANTKFIHFVPWLTAACRNRARPQLVAASLGTTP